MNDSMRRSYTVGPPSRRDFLVGAAALGASAMLGCRTASAPDTIAPRRIDVHHHLSPPSYIAALVAKDLGERPGLEWTPAKSIDDMARGGVATAVLSITTPGVWLGDNAAAVALARECNEYGAQLARDFPGRFGVFASLPLPEVDGSLREIEYALDVLHADGIGLLTSFGDKWLGDPAFAPVLDELNRRKAVVHVHPTVANCCRNLIPDLRDSTIEFATDTARAIASVLFTGTAVRCPDIRFIFSHAGGTMPLLIERFTRLTSQKKELLPRVPNGVPHELRRFYYDTAQSVHPLGLASLMRLVPVTQVVFGTDFPFRTSADHAQGLAEYRFDAADLQAINRGNAIKLMPRLAL